MTAFHFVLIAAAVLSIPVVSIVRGVRYLRAVMSDRASWDESVWWRS